MVMMMGDQLGVMDDGLGADGWWAMEMGDDLECNG